MGRRVEISKIVQANSLGVVLILTILFITRQEHFSRQMTFIFYVINIFLGVAVRLGIHTLLRAMRKQGFNQKHILLIGYSQTAKGYIDRIRANPQWGYTIVGILDDNIVSGKEYRGVKILGIIKFFASKSEKHKRKYHIALIIERCATTEIVAAVKQYGFKIEGVLLFLCSFLL